MEGSLHEPSTLPPFCHGLVPLAQPQPDPCHSPVLRPASCLLGYAHAPQEREEGEEGEYDRGDDELMGEGGEEEEEGEEGMGEGEAARREGAGEHLGGGGGGGSSASDKVRVLGALQKGFGADVPGGMVVWGAQLAAAAVSCGAACTGGGWDICTSASRPFARQAGQGKVCVCVCLRWVSMPLPLGSCVNHAPSKDARDTLGGLCQA